MSATGQVQDDAEPLVFTCRLSETDVFNMQRYNELIVLRKSIRRLAVAVTTFIAALSIWVAYVRWPTLFGKDLLVVMFFPALWLYLVFILPRERKWLARRQYRTNQAIFLETRVTISVDRIAFENSTMRSDFEWQVIASIGDTPQGVVFFYRI
jgi:hypothetical protein